MPKYRNTDLTVRCQSIMIQNPDSVITPSAKPSIEFQRELVVEVAGERGKRPLNNCRIAYTADNMTTEVAEIDPATDQPTGNTFTYADFYKMCYSVFGHASMLQDQADISREQLMQLAQQTGQPVM